MSLLSRKIIKAHKRVENYQTINPNPYPKVGGMKKGRREENFWPTDKLELGRERYLQEIKMDAVRERKVLRRLEQLGIDLTNLISEAGKIWPGAKMLAVDSQLVLVFGQQVGIPTEIGRTTVWGMDAQELKIRIKG